MEDISELNNLFKKYLNDDTTPEETAYLLERFSDPHIESLVLHLIEDNLLVDELQKSIEDSHLKNILVRNKHEIGQKLQVGESLPSAKIKYLWFYRIAAAATILISVSVGLLIYNLTEQTHKQPLSALSPSLIKPGSNKATLTLQDGSRIFLSDRPVGLLPDQGGVRIRKIPNGQINYEIQPLNSYKHGGKANKFTRLNTLATPRGGQYCVVLPDGTKVWLNASSSITYPLVFGVEERVIILKGEAYFEVAKCKVDGIKVPFIVKCDKQQVEVLGTHFNINGYPDEPSIKTTLIEGKVFVKIPKLSGTILLPGQQSKISREKNVIKVSNADLKANMAWKNNLFFFEGESIYSVMRQISRWYDVDITYRQDMSEKTVWGSLKRYDDINKVLKALELTGDVHFKIEGRKIIVRK